MEVGQKINMKIFDRKILQEKRNKIADNWQDYNFLKQEAAFRIVDLVADIAREFPFALDIGCHNQELANLLQDSGKAKEIISCDIAENMCPQIVCDEEFLPFKSNTFDLVTSALSLHHINDLVGSLIQVNDILKPDGFFAAVIFGANTLKELRESITAASAKYDFPLSPRISPFVEVRDAGALIQRSGFALPVITSETVTVNYDNPLKLMNDLRAMGEGNILLQRSRNPLTKSHLSAIIDYYRSNFSCHDGTVTASFEFITMTGWKPHNSQQKPAKRGSGVVNLKEVF